MRTYGFSSEYGTAGFNLIVCCSLPFCLLGDDDEDDADEEDLSADCLIGEFSLLLVVGVVSELGIFDIGGALDNGHFKPGDWESEPFGRTLSDILKVFIRRTDN
ncbi:unnamed protein product [Schistosoma mattheei]|uniref:Uncharacterized protein n=1 Tax=Schistosoma mattheei TaxID=31246 RepID=A0A183PTM7_9TREM|nr:unnamed protein product [Schistosoma mattheei]